MGRNACWKGSYKGKAMKMGAKIVGKGLARAAKAGVNFSKDELNKANPNLGLPKKKIFNSLKLKKKKCTKCQVAISFLQ